MMPKSKCCGLSCQNCPSKNNSINSCLNVMSINDRCYIYKKGVSKAGFKKPIIYQMIYPSDMIGYTMIIVIIVIFR